MGCDIHDALKRSTKVLSLQSQNAFVLGDDLRMKEETRHIIATNVQRLRKLRGWTQIDLARRCPETRQTTISSVERAAKAPTADTLEEIAAALNVPTWTLMVPVKHMSVDQLRRLGAVVNSYVATNQAGQEQIWRVAESEERYSRSEAQSKDKTAA